MMARRALSRLLTRLECNEIVKRVGVVRGIRLDLVPSGNLDLCSFRNLGSFGGNLLQGNYNLDAAARRWKHGKRRKGKAEDDEDDEELEEDEKELKELVAGSKGAKIVSGNASSMRIDAVLKGGLGVARTRAELAFYESRLRVNGQKVLKKAHQIYVNDVIDFIVGPSPKNPDFVVVHRLTVLDAKPNVDQIKLKVLREKNLVVDEYKDSYKISTD